MRQLVYALRFAGQATIVDPERKMYRTMTAAPSSAFVSTVGPDGLHATLESIAGEQARYEAEATVTDDNQFVEAGTISFGDGHSLQFTTVGHGSFDASPDPALVQGTVTLRVVGGTGQFTGAHGLITCNFLETRQRELVDHHFGVLFLP